MVDLHYSEPGLAELYDTFCEGRPDFRFYLPLVMLILGAGLVIDEQFGDWDRQPLTEASLEIITVARLHVEATDDQPARHR